MRDTGGEAGDASRRENTQKINTPTKREPSGFYYIFSPSSSSWSSCSPDVFFYFEAIFRLPCSSRGSPEELFRLERFHYAEVMLRDFFCLVLFRARSRTDRPTLSVPSRVVLCLECPVLASCHSASFTLRYSRASRAQ